MPVQIVLPGGSKKELQKPVRGTGGYQGMLKRFRKSLDTQTVLPALGVVSQQDVLTVSDEDFLRLANYMKAYGDGGFEGRLLRLLGLK